MSERYTGEAKAKEQETRRRLGRRIPKSEPAPFKPTANPKVPRATGAAGKAIGSGNAQ